MLPSFAHPVAGTWLSSRDGVEAPTHPSPKPRGAAAAARGDTGKGMPRNRRRRGKGKGGKKGTGSGKDKQVEESNTVASAFCQQYCIHRNLLPCWQLLLVREVAVVPAPRCRCSSCLGRSSQIPHPRKSCPARVDKLLTAAWGMEQKAGGLDTWQALDVYLGCLEDVCCALLGSILVPRTRCSSQCWDEWGGASRWAASVRWVLGCCAWRDGLEPGTHNTGMCWAVFLEKRAWCPCRSTSFCGSAFLKLQTVQPLLCGGYNLPTPLLTSLKDACLSCWEGTWVTIQKDPSSLKRSRSVYQSWKITVWRRC